MSTTDVINIASDDELHRAIRIAARWYVRLQGGEDATLRSELMCWLNASPLHQQAWREVQQTMTPIGQLPSELAAPALRGAASSRRQLLRRLLMVAAVAPLPWFAWRNSTWQVWHADLRTAIGERRRETLPDGSLLALDTDSAADLRFTPTTRQVLLQRGEILIETAPDVGAQRRPFTVITRHGSVTALGTRFVVRVDAQQTQVSVLDARVRVVPESGDEAVEIGAGQRIGFDASHCQRAQPADSAAGSWLGGSLVVVDMPLGQLAAELARYRVGFLACDPAIAELKVSGAFPLDDTDRALQVLTEAFPLRLQHLTRYWVRIVPA